MEEREKNKDKNKIYSNDTIGDVLSIMSSQVQANNLEAFKKYIDAGKGGIKAASSEVSYQYYLNLQLFREMDDEILQVNPETVLKNLGFPENATIMMGSVWTELYQNDDLNNNTLIIDNNKIYIEPDEILKTSGESAMRKIIDDAVPLVDFLWQITNNNFLTSTPGGRSQAEKFLKKELEKITDSELKDLFYLIY